jgi:hypothetical protein
MFTANLGTPDRIIRLVLGAVLIGLPFLGGPVIAGTWLAWAAPLLGLVLAGTAFLAFCPIYRAFGFSTRRREQH